MYTIIKKFGPYAASHRLTSVPEGHQCGRLHGHNYEIELELSGPTLNEQGFVVDYGELKAFDDYARARMDHRDLNEQFSFSPTAENLAKHFFDWIAGTTSWPIVAVRVSETPGKTESEYRRPPVPQTFVNDITVYVARDGRIVRSSVYYDFVQFLTPPRRRERL